MADDQCKALGPPNSTEVQAKLSAGFITSSLWTNYIDVSPMTLSHARPSFRQRWTQKNHAILPTLASISTQNPNGTKLDSFFCAAAPSYWHKHNWAWY
jgi:hypothetical protein